MYRGEIEHDARSRPVDVHGGGPVEHAAQGPVEQFAEPVDRGFDAAGEIYRVGASELCHLVDGVVGGRGRQAGRTADVERAGAGEGERALEGQLLVGLE